VSALPSFCFRVARFTIAKASAELRKLFAPVPEHPDGKAGSGRDSELKARMQLKAKRFRAILSTLHRQLISLDTFGRPIAEC
jgi:hypothetical protein